MRNQGAGDGDTLLLSARQGGDALVFKPDEGDHTEHFFDPLLDFCLCRFFQPQRERDVFIHIQMRKKGIFLEHGVDVPLVCGHAADLRSLETKLTLVSRLESADDAERCRLSATGGTEKRDELSVSDVEIDSVQHFFAVKRL